MRGVRGMWGLSRWTCWLEISIIWYSVMLAVRMGPRVVVVEEGEGSAGGVASAGCAAAAGLDVLDVFPVVVGDGGSPGADGGEVGADLGEGFEAVGFVAREGEAR